MARETFTVKPGVEMVVDYGVSGQACQIKLPPYGPEDEAGVQSTLAIDRFLLELLPPIVRGKELLRSLLATGRMSVSIVQYDNLSISELLDGERRTGVNVMFHRDECGKSPTQ